ncbi:MAG: efflux RND transporter periplasmic adaptor subunit [Phycisphaerae bacterium]|nr:efflux RND transporter periplasmic adaptor subunit [Phycisphaerae bacterium]
MKKKQIKETVQTDPKPLGLIIKLLLPVVIIAAAAGFFGFQMKTRPVAERKTPPRQAKQVHVTVARRTDVRAVLDYIQGPVMPAQEVTLSPQVSGLIVTMSPALIPGGIVTQGHMLLGIDPSDYELALKQRRSDVARARLNLELERGNQAIARQEFEMLKEEVSEQDQALVLREPHLADAQAALEAAQAAVSRAELDLSRCLVMAPFNAVIREKKIDLGTRVSPGSTLVSLAGTDEYWIEAEVPVSKLQWIDVPSGMSQTGSRVTIYDPATWGPGLSREGQVIRLLSDIDPGGLMARVLVSVQDPLALLPENQGKPVLLLGALVDLEIKGDILESVIPLQREWLHDENRVWVMAEDNTLKTQEVTISFPGYQQVCVVAGLEDGQRVVITDIAAPVEGMPLVMAAEVTTEPNQPESESRKGVPL